MNLDIFDTHAVHSDGETMHFDVLLPEGGDKQLATTFALQWLKTIGIQPANINLQSCRFCHSEQASAEIEQTVSAQGFAILQMEGCPSPIF